MRKAGALLLLMVAGIVATDPKLEVDIESHLKNLGEQRYPNNNMNEGRAKAQEEIRDAFVDFGLHVLTQRFNTSVEVDPLNLEQEFHAVDGLNIIGISKATSNKEGAVVVVAADYDTNGQEDPYFSNGAGVATLLETARLFTQNVKWSRFHQNFTTIFVAFDLNTKEHKTSVGKPGSWFFVHEWLWPFLNQSSKNFGGAFIIDSVLNINLEENSQLVDDDFRKLFPDTYNNIVNKGKKGDFLGTVSPSDTKSQTLVDQFSGGYNMERKRLPFHLETMAMPEVFDFSNLLVELSKQSTIHFWTFNPDGNATPLPAILITDTEKLRQVPESSCNKACPFHQILTEQRREFVDTTVKALTRTLLRRQATLLPEGGDGAASTIPSALMMVALFLLGRFYQ